MTLTNKDIAVYRTERREAITFKNKGAKLFGIFHRPLAPPPYPTIVFAHGLAGHKTGRYRVYVDLATELCKRGFGVFRFDFRGSGDSEGDFETITPYDEVSDLLQAIEFIKTDPDVDVNRIGLFGRSFGGIVAVLAAAKIPDTIKSIALWAPLYSTKQWKEMWTVVQANPDLEDYRTINGQLGGIPFFEELFQIDIEPSFKKLDSIPLLHIHGEQDTVVLPSHAEEYEEGRKGVKAISKFVRLPETDHDLTKRAERYMAIKETVDWFQYTLGDL